MNGALHNLMRQDAKKLTNSGGFEVPIIFTDLDGNTETVLGHATLHSTIFNEEGLPAIGKNGHVTVCLSDFGTLNVYSNTKEPNEVSMANWGVSFTYIDGKTWKFKAEGNKPSYTFDIITIELGDAE